MHTFTAPTFQPVLPAYNLATLRQASHTDSHLGGGRTSCPILFDLATKSFAQFTSTASTRGLRCTRQRESKQAYHCNCRTSTFKAPSATTYLSPPTFISIMKSPPEVVKSMQRAVLPGLPTSQAVHAYCRPFIRTRRLPLPHGSLSCLNPAPRRPIVQQRTGGPGSHGPTRTT